MANCGRAIVSRERGRQNRASNQRQPTQPGLTIVVATHDLNFAASLCHSIVMLAEGRVVAAGPTGDTLTSMSIQALYGVVADVYPHHAAGHLTVVPLRRIRRD